MGSIGDYTTEKKTTYLIPILTEREFDDDFLEHVKAADSIILMYVMDSGNMQELPSGFMGGRIKGAEAIMDKYRKKFRSKNVIGSVEWGSWESKLKSYAILRKVDMVLMRNCPDAPRFAKMLKREKVSVKVI